jgi:hypothetical protein
MSSRRRAPFSLACGGAYHVMCNELVAAIQPPMRSCMCEPPQLAECRHIRGTMQCCQPYFKMCKKHGARTMWLRQEAARRLFAREVSRDASPSTAVSSWLTSCRHVRNAPKERKSVGRSCCSRCACRCTSIDIKCCAYHECLQWVLPINPARTLTAVSSSRCNCELWGHIAAE